MIKGFRCKAACADGLTIFVTEGFELADEFVTQRVGPHSKGDDTRDPQTMAAARARDWYRRYERECPERLAAADARQRARLAEVFGEVESRGPAVWER